MYTHKQDQWGRGTIASLTLPPEVRNGSPEPVTLSVVKRMVEILQNR